MKNRVFFLICLWLFSASAYTQTCNNNIIPTTPTVRFINNQDGTVKDSLTKLIWKRCPEGKTLSDNATPDDLADDNCNGSVVEISWQEALQLALNLNTNGGYANSNSWRLPNIKELASIIELQCYAPAFNEVIFPSMVGPNAYWSSSHDSSNGEKAWVLHTWYGSDSKEYKVSYPAGVILVRDE